MGWPLARIGLVSDCRITYRVQLGKFLHCCPALIHRDPLVVGDGLLVFHSDPLYRVPRARPSMPLERLGAAVGRDPLTKGLCQDRGLAATPRPDCHNVACIYHASNVTGAVSSRRGCFVVAVCNLLDGELRRIYFNMIHPPRVANQGKLAIPVGVPSTYRRAHPALISPVTRDGSGINPHLKFHVFGFLPGAGCMVGLFRRLDALLGATWA